VELLTSLLVGIGLSAACGFRVFLPLLGMSAAAHFGDLPVVPGFEWLASLPAFLTLLTATAVEVVAYYIPWLDNALDAITTPLALAAGTMITASQIDGLPPYAQWGLAAIAGGGASALVQAGTVAGRATSSATTGGLGNGVVATAEVLLSAGLTAYLLPGVAIFLGVCVVVLIAAGGFIAFKLVKRTIGTDPDAVPLDFTPAGDALCRARNQ
jgi:hypothetical protein